MQAHDSSDVVAKWAMLVFAIGLSAYVIRALIVGRITVRSITSIRQKQPFQFWFDTIALIIISAMLWTTFFVVGNR
jgi:hydrogenase-4 membrane subunit HyfE